jgi:hypothetical protein
MAEKRRQWIVLRVRFVRDPDCTYDGVGAGQLTAPSLQKGQFAAKESQSNDSMLLPIAYLGQFCCPCAIAGHSIAFSKYD